MSRTPIDEKMYDRGYGDGQREARLEVPYTREDVKRLVEVATEVVGDPGKQTMQHILNLMPALDGALKPFTKETNT